MYDKFRVICCENREKYPGKLFIDIYPADHITHELLYRMRLKLTPVFMILPAAFILMI